jgi:hypothetical protein
MQKFKTTADVFAVVKPDKNGAYQCPIKGCKKKLHANSKDFGRHLAIAHKIRSDKAGPKYAKLTRGKKRLALPELHTKFCPNCGFNIEQAEQAAVLLRSGGR